ncbi:hypothetical protein V1525DRAFT_456651 [Lipomyces kononenkoae]|uniref:Uncharacterized protein n=1 Tax=Lipomyces kononenkoae TaxID=34357 RepID=A0ACC3T182_LIPKO
MGNSASSHAATGDLYRVHSNGSVKLRQRSGPQDPYRKLHQLLRANHATYAVLYNNRRFHNHMPHLLGSAYLLGANAKQLVDLYEAESKFLEPWKEDSPAEVTADDWRNFYGQRVYQRGYKDYFDDEVMQASYDWKRVVSKYLLADDATLLNGVIGGFAHPLIHLAYAYELDSAEIATEALTLVTTNYPSYAEHIEDFVNKYEGLTSPSTAKYLEEDPLVILEHIRTSKVFNTMRVDLANDFDFPEILAEYKQEILVHIYKLDVTDVEKTLQRLFHTASLLLTATHQPGNYQFDFVLLHTLTASHAVQVLFSRLMQKRRVSMIGSLWYFIVLAYISTQRPKVDQEKVLSYDGVPEKHRNWDYVVDMALTGKMKDDAHYVKAIRALKTLAGLYPASSDLYLREAVLFATEADGYVFGTNDPDPKKWLDGTALTITSVE